MHDQKTPPTFFEITTALAFQYFKKHAVDFAIIEVGLGGRYDATNVINPQVSVITNISLEHTDRLGETISDIAYEKAGIIKEKCPVITAAATQALHVIQRIAEQKHAPLTIISDTDWHRTAATTHTQSFTIHGRFHDYTVDTCSLGHYQGENIALAINTIETLQQHGVYISENSIEQGIQQTHNPGRMEIIHHDPLIILDGAHNSSAIEQLTRSLTQDFTYDHLWCIIGISADKNIKLMLSRLLSIVDTLIVSQSTHYRACDATKLYQTATSISPKKQIVLQHTLQQAFEYARTHAQPSDLICCTGSLFTVGEARSLLAKKTPCTT